MRGRGKRSEDGGGDQNRAEYLYANYKKEYVDRILGGNAKELLLAGNIECSRWGGGPARGRNRIGRMPAGCENGMNGEFSTDHCRSCPENGTAFPIY